MLLKYHILDIEYNYKALLTVCFTNTLLYIAFPPKYSNCSIVVFHGKLDYIQNYNSSYAVNFEHFLFGS